MFLVMCFLIYIKPLEYSSINADHNAFILEFKLIFIKKKTSAFLPTLITM